MERRLTPCHPGPQRHCARNQSLPGLGPASGSSLGSARPKRGQEAGFEAPHPCRLALAPLVIKAKQVEHAVSEQDIELKCLRVALLAGLTPEHGPTKHELPKPARP